MRGAGLEWSNSDLVVTAVVRSLTRKALGIEANKFCISYHQKNNFGQNIVLTEMIQWIDDVTA